MANFSRDADDEPKTASDEFKVGFCLLQSKINSLADTELSLRPTLRMAEFWLSC